MGLGIWPPSQLPSEPPLNLPLSIWQERIILCLYTNHYDDKSILCHYTFHLVHQPGDFRFDNGQRTLERPFATIVVVAVEQRHVGKQDRKRFMTRYLTGNAFSSPSAARGANRRRWRRPIASRQRSRAQWVVAVSKHERIVDFSSLNDLHSLINLGCGDERSRNFCLLTDRYAMM